MNRMKKKREIKYPKLYECSQLEQDDYWKDFFENLSRGKTVKKLILTDTNLEFVQKSKNVVYVYKDKSPELILDQCKELIRQKLHIHSKKDIYNNQHIWNNEQNELNTLSQQDDWKKIRNKNMKYFLLMKYSIHMKNIKNLTWKTANIFFKTITDALFVIHTHKSIDVYMENGAVCNIKDIIITDSNLIQNNRVEKLDSKKERKDSKLSLWDKYLTNITKMYVDSKLDSNCSSQIKNTDDEEETNEDMFQTNLYDDDYETICTSY
jgi:hypothetical protein